MSVFLYGIKPKPVDNNAESEQQPLTKKDPFNHRLPETQRWWEYPGFPRVFPPPRSPETPVRLPDDSKLAVDVKKIKFFKYAQHCMGLCGPTCSEWSATREQHYMNPSQYLKSTLHWPNEIADAVLFTTKSLSSEESVLMSLKQESVKIGDWANSVFLTVKSHVPLHSEAKYIC